MLTVILAGGKSTRFTHEGFPKQKHLLPMPDNRTLLEWQVEFLRPEKLVFISRLEYKNSERTTLMKINRMVPSNFMTVWIDKPTTGPLDGLLFARSLLNTDSELLISYNDELVLHGVLQAMIDRCRKYNYVSALIAFNTDNPRFTPVPNRPGLFAGCTYWFRSGKDFLKKAKKLKVASDVGCPHVVYSFRHWYAHEAKKGEVIELGTAREYKMWAAKQGMTKERMGF